MESECEPQMIELFCLGNGDKKETFNGWPNFFTGNYPALPDVFSGFFSVTVDFLLSRLLLRIRPSF